MFTRKPNMIWSRAAGLSIGLAILLASSSQATPNTWFVSPAGSDSSGDGSYDNPWATLTNAINRANKGNGDWYIGDTIVVSNGTYTTTYPTINTNMAIIGQSVTGTILQATATYAPTPYGTSIGRVFTVTTGTNVSFKNLTIRYGVANASNTGGGTGGAIYDQAGAGSMLTISNCLICSNQVTAGGGGGVYVATTVSLYVYDSTFMGNTAATIGGGLYCGGKPYIYNSTFYANLATNTGTANAVGGAGGGLALQQLVTGLVQNCTICNNTAAGGANSLYGGGGIWAYCSGAGSYISLRNCTIVGNAMPNNTSGGGGLCNYAGAQTGCGILVESCLIASNTASTTCPDVRVANGTTVERYNFVGDGTGASAYPSGTPNAHSSYVGTSAAKLAAYMGPLINNGGPTMTLALLAGSWYCIDHGVNNGGAIYDQRGSGYLRTYGTQPDIGAYEYGAGPTNLTYSTTVFSATGPDSGNIDNSNPMLLTLTRITFSGSDGAWSTNGTLAVTNLPDGLTVSMIRTNAGAGMLVQLTGSATSHAAANSISNLVFAFQDAAFTGGTPGVASHVDGSSRTDLSIVFYDVTVAGNLAFSDTNFYENAIFNDGRTYTTNTITLSGDTFKGADNSFMDASKAGATGVPAGLTAVVTRVNSTTATFALTGNALSHAAVDSVYNLVLAFSNAAFTGGNAAAITNSVTTNNVLFLDPATDIEMLYSGTTFHESPVNDGSIFDVIAITLSSNIFTGADGDVFDASKVQVANLPANLTAVVTRVNLTTLHVALTGNAVNHNRANNVNNLTLAFQDAAFYHGVPASAVTNSTMSNLQILFLDPAIAWTGSFAELMPADNSTIDPSTVVIGTLAGETFNDPANHFTPNNVPSGLTMLVTSNSPTQVTVALTGTATAGTLADSIANLGLTFGDSAFTHGGASIVTNSSVANWTVNFFDPSKTWYVSTNGSDSTGTGTNPASPFATITYAITMATNWDTIHILPGILTESPTNSGISVSQPLILEGDDTISRHGVSIVQAASAPKTSSSRVFAVAANVAAIFRNLTIRYGNDNSGGGGGIYGNGETSLLVSNCVLTENRTTASGGGICANNAVLTNSLVICASTVSSNESCFGGGGIYASGSLLKMFLYDSTVFGNSATSASAGPVIASGLGAGIALNQVSTGLIQNCTICNNAGASTTLYTYGGGGVWSYPNGIGGTVTIRNSTIAGNSVPNSIGGGICYYNNLILQSTIVAGNTAAIGHGPDMINSGFTGNGPTILTESFNLIGNNTNSFIAAGQPNTNNSYAGTAAALDPLLLPLAANGGPTKTCALQAGSLAIDHGSNPAGLLYDQRENSPNPAQGGYDRVIHGQADIGAFEYGAGLTVPGMYITIY